MSGIVVSSRVRLARNYQDLPFRGRISPQQAEECIQRTLSALRDMPEIYHFRTLRGLEDMEKRR